MLGKNSEDKVSSQIPLKESAANLTVLEQCTNKMHCGRLLCGLGYELSDLLAFFISHVYRFLVDRISMKAGMKYDVSSISCY